MIRPSIGAAFAAVLFTGFLLCPQASSVHLVSNQPTGTDNQNDSPVHYVPQMAAKLGLPQPINREPEEDPLAEALRQLIEHNKRQSVFIERLAALAPKSKTPVSSQTRKKSTNPQTRTPQASAKAQTRTPQTTTNSQTRSSTNPQTRTSTNSQTRTSTNPQTRTPTNSQTRTLQTTTKPNDSVIMHPAKQVTEDANGSISVKHFEPNTSNKTLVEKVSVRLPNISPAQNPNKLLHLSKDHPVRHILSYAPPSLPFPVRLPINNSPGFYPHFVDPQSMLGQGYPYSAPYPNPIHAKTIIPEHRVQYPVNLHFPDVMPRYLYPVNPQPAPAAPSVSPEHEARHQVKPHIPDAMQRHLYPVNSQPAPEASAVSLEHKAPHTENPHFPDVTQRYFYPVNPQPAPAASSLSAGHKAQHLEKPHIPGAMQRYLYPMNSQPAPAASSVFPEHKALHPVNPHFPDVMQRYLLPVHPQPAPAASPVSQNFSWQYPFTPEDNLRQNYVYRIKSQAEQ